MDVFRSLRSVVKLDSVCIDNNIFRLHYKATVGFLIACSLLVTSRQYFGDPIDCIQRDDIPPNIIDTYCWIHSTFTLPDAFDKKVGDQVPHPGIDKYVPGERRTYHKYYQWVCFVLFFQALAFYVPRYLWKTCEAGRMRTLVMGLGSPIISEDAKNEQIGLLISYIKRNLKYHDTYFTYYIICEFLNFVNVIGQMYVVDAFLGGAFSTYGWDVLRYSEMEQEYRVDPMIRVFPRMTKCTFHRYGSSGDVQRHDALCILPLNIVNEKIYIFLWFWFYLLAIVTSVLMLYRLVVWFWPKTRIQVLRSRGRFVRPEHIDIVMQHCEIGDWFILDLLAKNCDPQIFREFMEELAKEFDTMNGKIGGLGHTGTHNSSSSSHDDYV